MILRRYNVKKSIYWICIVLLFLTVWAISPRKNNIRYPAGRDTVESFGDGTYQILSGTCDVLSNEKYGNCIIERVYEFCESSDKVYVIGSPVHGYVDGYIPNSADGECLDTIYAIIELQDNTMQLYLRTEDPSKHISIYRLEEMVEKMMFN